MKNLVNGWLFELLGFFFPAYCPVCGVPMHQKWEVICLTCEQKMPLTNYTFEKENPVAELFWGRTKLAGATSLFKYEKGSAYQSLIHLLKYHGVVKIGVFLGIMMGQDIAGTEFSKADFIIPVPLHQNKQRKRGFNQSEVIAKGISMVAGIPILPGMLLRKDNTNTQTNRSRYERWENTEKVFTLSGGAYQLEGFTILLVDDVVTTGSTLEACAETLRQIPGINIYVATAACA